MKLTRVQSREVFPVPERPHYIIKLTKQTVDFYLQGKDMPDDKIGDVLVGLINALNQAENQINMLFKVIKEAEVHKDFLEDYLDEFPEEEDYRRKYKIEDLKDALFHAMMKKDEKMISAYINQINVLQERYSKLANEEKENG